MPKRYKARSQTKYLSNNCVTASGLYLPPFVVCKSKVYLNQSWCKDGPTGTVYTRSDSGWMEKLQFIKWLERLFIPAVKAIGGEHILVLDGHSTHVSMKVIEIYKKTTSGWSAYQLIQVIFCNHLTLEYIVTLDLPGKMY